MESAEIIIIGAGAAGLMAAYQLVKAGKKIILIEARNRVGGRIHTINDPAYDQLLEAGAEFIHGNLPTTFKLLEEAAISYYETTGKSWVYKQGKLRQGEDLIENWAVLMDRVKKVKDDLPISAFLDQYLNEPAYAVLRTSVKSFVEGYDAADTSRTSTLAMKEEWSNEEQWVQYRPEEGYIKLINYLAETCRATGAVIHLSSIIKKVTWSKDHIEVVTSDGKTYGSSKLVIAVPLGVLQSAATAEAHIDFSPAIPEKINAAMDMGYGAVIKIILQFNHPFWNDVIDDQRNKMSEMGYLFTEAFIPTWWTQFPKSSALLTGWLAGPGAAALKDATNEIILDKAIESLSEIFFLDKDILEQKLKSTSIFNWTADPFALGAYAYHTTKSTEAKKQMKQPVENTLFFTGEALGKGSEAGTVEIALAAGEAVAKEIISGS